MAGAFLFLFRSGDSCFRSKPSVHNDRYRVRDACLAAEQRYGLWPTAPADRTAPRSPTRGEREKAAGRGLGEASRVTLRRQVATAAAGSASGPEFFAALEAAGVLVRLRYSTRNPGEVTGYAVALPGDTGPDGGPVWYGGGKLAADLTWPRLRQRWAGPGGPPGPGPGTAADPEAVWEQAARAAAEATGECQIFCARGFSLSGSGCLSGTVFSRYLMSCCPVYPAVRRNRAFGAVPGLMLRVPVFPASCAVAGACCLILFGSHGGPFPSVIKHSRR